MLLIWILLALALALLLVLAVPVEFRFSVHRDEAGRRGNAAIGWLFGLVEMHPSARTRGHSGSMRPSRRKAHRRRLSGMGRALQVEGFAHRVLWLMQHCLRSIRIRELAVNARIGLDDPADTGRLWAILGPGGALLALPRTARIVIVPDFTQEVFEFDGRGDVRVVPLRILAAFLLFLFSPTTIRAMYAVVRGRP